MNCRAVSGEEHQRAEGQNEEETLSHSVESMQQLLKDYQILLGVVILLCLVALGWGVYLFRLMRRSVSDLVARRVESEMALEAQQEQHQHEPRCQIFTHRRAHVSQIRTQREQCERERHVQDVIKPHAEDPEKDAECSESDKAAPDHDPARHVPGPHHAAAPHRPAPSAAVSRQDADRPGDARR